MVMLALTVPVMYVGVQDCADGWLVKPLDSLRLRAAVDTVVAGGSYHEGATPVTTAAD